MGVAPKNVHAGTCVNYSYDPVFFFLQTSNALTLKWSRYSVLPLVVGGGEVPMDPNSEKYFPE